MVKRGMPRAIAGRLEKADQESGACCGRRRAAQSGIRLGDGCQQMKTQTATVHVRAYATANLASGCGWRLQCKGSPNGVVLRGAARASVRQWTKRA